MIKLNNEQAEVQFIDSLIMKIKEESKRKRVRRSIIVRKAYRQIQVSQRVFYQNMKTYKGNRRDTNLLNINFKTIICKILDYMCFAKQISPQEIAFVSKYKSSPPSFNSLIQLIYKPIQQYSCEFMINHTLNYESSNKKQLTNQKTIQISKKYIVRSDKIFKRLQKLFETSQIIQKIHQTEGTLVNKLFMLKYIQAIRYTIIGQGQIVKWKQLKEVSVLK